MTDDQQYDVFLSYNSLDHVHVERVAKELQARNCTSFIDRWYLTPGHDWVVALEQALQASRAVAIFLGPHEMGRWQQRERAWALDQLAGRDDYPVIPVLLPGCEPPLGFLKQLMWIDLREDPTSSSQIDSLAAAIRSAPVDRNEPLQPQVTICPYRGLRAFREEDASFFFGRDVYQQQLVSLIERQTLVAVIGASGSGKSSLVSAGLVPKLRQTGSGPVWDVVRMIPHVDPLYSLAEALVPLIDPNLTGLSLEREINVIAHDLEQDQPTTPLWGLVNAVLRQQPGTGRLLLFVDQWEELYTNCENAKRGERFVQELLEATSRQDSPLSVVLTVRGDFYNEILRDRPLLDRIQSGRLDLGPMNADELCSTIVGPAKKVGLTFQDGLVDRILQEAGAEPGSLPLLEFALEELWKRREGLQLTHAGYEDLGRQPGLKHDPQQVDKGSPLSRAIATYADSVYDELTPDQQQALPALFRKLVRAGSKSDEDTRRRVGLREMDDTTRRVARTLAQKRLLMTAGSLSTDEALVDQAGLKDEPSVATTSPAEESSAGTTVEVAHEELLRRWGRLREWVDFDREFLLWRSRLELKVDEYQRDGDVALLRDRPLQDAKKYYPARADDLDANQRHFLDLCLKGETKRRVRFLRTISAAILLLIAIFGVTWNVVSGERQQSLKRELVTLVDSLQNSSGPAVAYGLRDLHKIRHDKLVFDELWNRYKDLQLPCKLALAYGLADFDEVASENKSLPEIRHENVKYLCSQISIAAPDEVDNLVTALKKSRSESLEELKRLAHEVDGNQDWRLKTRLAVIALHLQDASIAADMCQTAERPDPVQRTMFVELFPTWHGNVASLTRNGRNLKDSALTSGLCLGIGGISPERITGDERTDTAQILKELYESAPQGVTHSSAGWALVQWRIELPALAPTSLPVEGRDWFINSLEMTMLQIQPGSFVRKDPEVEKSVNQKVTLTRPFFLSDREVTVGQFQQFVDDPKYPSEEKPEKWEGANRKISRTLEHPVQQVNWNDAVLFCNWLSKKERPARKPCYERVAGAANEWRLLPGGTGYRLPTEAEWEYACRAGTSTDYSFGNDPEFLRKYATLYSGTTHVAAPCGGKLPNGWGLFEIHGNVWEWCHDWFDAYGDSELRNPLGPAGDHSYRVIRGGNWTFDASACWSGFRGTSYPDHRDYVIGFRVALSPSGLPVETKEPDGR